MTRPTLPVLGDTSASGWGTKLTSAIGVVSDKADTNPYLLVASVDSPAAVLAIADYVCDGVDDHVQINQAIDLAAALNSRNSTSPSGATQRGMVLLTGGRFNISSGILMRTGVRLTGHGWLTELRATTCNTAGMIMLQSVNEHACQVDHLYLYGNYSSGGSCSGIDFEMTGSTNTGVTTYPSTSPDSYHHITDLYIDGFTSTAGRNGIKIWCSASANNRGNIVSRIQIRNISNHGLWFVSASDDIVSDIHIGTTGGSGFYMESSNIRMTNCKSFYADGANGGFYLAGDCISGSVLEAQECHTGFVITGAGVVLTSVLADLCRDDAIYINRSRVTIDGFAVTWKTGMRYGTAVTTNGVRIGTSATADLNLIGFIGSATQSATNRVSGTIPTSGSFARITGNGALLSTG